MCRYHYKDHIKSIIIFKIIPVLFHPDYERKYLRRLSPIFGDSLFVYSYPRLYSRRIIKSRAVLAMVIEIKVILTNRSSLIQ